MFKKKMKVNCTVELLLRCASCPVLYKQKDDLLELVEESTGPPRWKPLRRAHSTPGSIPAMVTQWYTR